MTKENVNLEKRAGLNRESPFGYFTGINADAFDVVSADMVVLEKFENGQPGGSFLFSSNDFLIIFNLTGGNLDFDLVWEGPDGGFVILDSQTVNAGSSNGLSVNSILFFVGGKLRLRETSGGVLTPGKVKCVRTTTKYTKNYFQVIQAKMGTEYTQPEITGAYGLDNGVSFGNFSTTQNVTISAFIVLPDGTEFPNGSTVVAPGTAEAFGGLPAGFCGKYTADVTPQNMYLLDQSIFVVNNSGSPEPVL